MARRFTAAAGILAALSVPLLVLSQAMAQPAGSRSVVDLDTTWRVLGQIVSILPDLNRSVVMVRVINTERTGFVLSAAGEPVVFGIATSSSTVLAANGLVPTSAPGMIITLDIHPSWDTLASDPLERGTGAGAAASSRIYVCPATRPAVLPAPGCASVPGGRTLGVGPSLEPANRTEWAELVGR